MKKYLIIVTVLAVIAGCQNKTVKKEDLVGTWKIVEYDQYELGLTNELVEKIEESMLHSVYTFTSDMSCYYENDALLESESSTWELVDDGKTIVIDISETARKLREGLPPNEAKYISDNLTYEIVSFKNNKMKLNHESSTFVLEKQ